MRSEVEAMEAEQMRVREYVYMMSRQIRYGEEDSIDLIAPLAAFGQN